MGIFTLLLFILLFVVSMLLEEKNKARDEAVSKQFKRRASDLDVFCSVFGTGKERMKEMDIFGDPALVKHIETRLEEEADVRRGAIPDCLISDCDFVSLGLLAQYGLIPERFIKQGIKWSADCVTTRLEYSEEAIQMMERFIKWYDKELTDHGVEEHLLQRKEAGVLDSLSDLAFSDQTVEVRYLEHLRRGDVLFWAPARISTLTGCRVSGAFQYLT